MSAEVSYRGIRDREGGLAVTVDGAPLAPRLDLVNHSPSGFEYGYGGSGPAQLSLAILADHLARTPEDHTLAATIAAWRGGPLDDAGRAASSSSSDALAIGCHQAFKFAVVARLSGESFRLTSAEISAALRQLAGRTS